MHLRLLGTERPGAPDHGMQAGSGMLRENSGTRSDMKSGSGNDPRSCQNVDVWGELPEVDPYKEDADEGNA